VNNSGIDLKIINMLKAMEKAMPEIRRQVEVYERSLKHGIDLIPQGSASKIKTD